MKSGQFGQRMPCLTRPNAVNTSYGYDGDNLIEEANSNGAVIARYTQAVTSTSRSRCCAAERRVSTRPMVLVRSRR
jgi:hypothetical protein